jgi:Flp pilus assembly protein TadD
MPPRVLLLFALAGCASPALLAARQNVIVNAGDPAAWDDVGDAYALAGRRGDARRAYAQALQLDPDDERARAALAEIGAPTSRLERRALASPMDDEVWGDLGDWYVAQGRHDEARAAYAHANQLDPSDAEWQNALATMGGPELLTTLAATVDTTSDEQLGDLADAYRAAGREAEACDLYRQAWDLDRGDGEWQARLAECGELPEVPPPEPPALDALEATLRGDAGLLYRLGMANLAHGERDRGRAYLWDALLLEPGDPDIGRAWVAATGEPLRTALERLVASKPDDASAVGALGDVLLLAGDIAAARTRYARAAELAPSGPWKTRLDLLEPARP